MKLQVAWKVTYCTQKMESPSHMALMMDSYRCDLYPSKFSFATLPMRCPVVEDSDIGWEPEPMIASLPKYVSPCNGDADVDRVSLSPRHYDFELFIAKTNCLEGGGPSISKCTREASSWSAPDGAVSDLQISHGAHSGQVAAPSLKTSGDYKGLRTSLGRPRRASSRKRHSLEIGMEAGLASELSGAAASEGCAVSVTKEHRSTKRKTTHNEQPVNLNQEQKKKSCLEKNRIAAASCRLKRQRRESELQTRSHELALSNSALKEIVSGMHKELQQLKLMLSGHRSNECCQMSTELGGEFTEGAVDECFQQMECGSEDSYETIASLYSDSNNMEFYDDHAMFFDDADLQTFSPLDSGSAA